MTWSKSSPYRFPKNGAKPSETMTLFFKTLFTGIKEGAIAAWYK